MNSFEQFTLIIGVLAILFETISHIKNKIKRWFGAHGP